MRDVRLINMFFTYYMNFTLLGGGVLNLGQEKNL